MYNYHTQTHEITVTDDSAEILDLSLVRYNEPPDTPIITGSGDGLVGCEYEFIVVAYDLEGDDIYYMIDWGDGTQSEWLGSYPSGVEIKIYHVFNVSGEYEVRVKVKDIYADESPWSDPIQITINPNTAPDKPNIDGPKRGIPGNEYDYTFRSTDPETLDLYYYIEWDDGNTEEWIGPYSSGVGVTVSHKWSERGRFTIKAKARDECGAESNWAELIVTMPRYKAITSPFLNFLRNHLNLFPILPMLLQRLGLQ